MAVSCRPSCQSLQQTTGSVGKAESRNFKFNSCITFNTANSTAMDAKRIHSESESEYHESMEDVLMSLLDGTHLAPSQAGNDSKLTKDKTAGSANHYEYLLDSQYDDISENEGSVVSQGYELDLLGDFQESPSNGFYPAIPGQTISEQRNTAAQVEEREKANSLTQSSDLRENGSLQLDTNHWNIGSYCPGPPIPGHDTETDPGSLWYCQPTQPKGG